MNFKITSTFLLLSNLVAAQDENCAPIEQLGTPNLDRFNYSIEMEKEKIGKGACEYEVKISFKHDETLPMVTDPANQCNPAKDPPEFADDGLPYFAFRWNYQTVPDEIKTVTGIDHVSIDWNPCGHPPVDVFGAPHYDLHIYLESPEYRSCMTCTTIPGAPVCDPTPGVQTTPNGQAFFNVDVVDEEETQPANMPAGFVVGMFDFVPLMGGHAWNPNQQPPSSMEWVNPIWIMGPYDGTIVDYEPMIPFAFMSGETDKEFTELLSYEGQSIKYLPSCYKVEYEAATKMVTISLKGVSMKGKACKKKKGDKKKAKKAKKEKKEKKEKMNMMR